MEDAMTWLLMAGMTPAERERFVDGILADMPDALKQRMRATRPLRQPRESRTVVY
jgi:hypothetical protein